MIKRGLDVSLSHLFVIDGSKALRSTIDEVLGKAAQTRAVMMAAYKHAPGGHGQDEGKPNGLSVNPPMLRFHCLRV